MMIPQYSTKLFTNVWDNVDSFRVDVEANPLNILTEESIINIYYLLYAQYGNSPIANDDVNQFKFKIYSILYKYGGTWEKRVDIQKKLRALSDEEIRSGTKAISNHALNPSSDPATCSEEEILTINDQSVQNYKKSKMAAYGELWNLLAVDVTSEFINRFKVCFKPFVMPEHPVLYEEID